MRRFWNFIKSLFYKKNAPIYVPSEPIKPEEISPPAVSSGFINFTFGETKNATDSEKIMIAVAFSYLRAVVLSSDFKEEVMKAKFTNTNGLSNEQIYKLYIETPFVVNVHMFSGSYWQNKVYHTVGYEAGDGYVHANRAFVWSAYVMCSLMLHELSHTLGFHHDSSTEYTSIPYKMNDIAERLMDKFGIKNE